MFTDNYEIDDFSLANQRQGTPGCCVSLLAKNRNSIVTWNPPFW